MAMTAPPETPPSLGAADARRAARNVGALMAASLLSKGALFAWQIVLAPWLGAADYGIYTTVASLLAIGGLISNFGFGLIVIRDVAREPGKAGHYWTAMLFMQTALAGLAYAAVLLAGAAAGYSTELLAYAAVAGISLLVDIFGTMCSDLLLAQEKMLHTSLVDIVHIGLRIGLALLALAAGWGLMGVYGAAITAGVLRAAALWGLNLRAGLRPAWPLDRGITRLLFFNSLPLALSALLSLFYQHADKLMTTAIIGEEGTGYLGPAFVINFGVIEMLSTTVLVATYPLLSRYYASDRPAMFGFMAGKLVLFMLIAGLPLALVFSIYAYEITTLLFSPQFAPTAGILSILIWYTMITMVGNVFSKAMLVQNRQRLLLAIRGGALALNVLLNAYLLARYQDPRGAAVASIAAELLALALMLRFFRAEGWRWQELLPRLARLLPLAAATAFVMLLLRGPAAPAGMAAGLLLYAAGLLLAGALRADDWDLLYRITAALPGGRLLHRVWKRDVAINW